MATLDFATVITGVLAVIILVDVSVLVISGKPVPELLSNLAFGVFGFYFGRRVPLPRPERAREPAVEPPAGARRG